MTPLQFPLCGLWRSVFALGLLASGCRAAAPAEAPRKALRIVSEDPSLASAGAVEAVLDDWHLAASEVDAARYLSHLSADARFLGTDAGERWDRETFVSYVNHYFVGEQRGWTYLPRDRHVELSPDGSMAWFDELLDNDGYGELRGTGVLRREGAVWRITQYSMTFTVPNDVGREVAARIRQYRGTVAPREAGAKH